MGSLSELTGKLGKGLKKYKYACAVNQPLLKYRISTTGKSGVKLKSAKSKIVYTFFSILQI